jgi:TetR/AcrR family transcriptional regulator, mexCD-oprJ operon repressor
MTSMACAIAPDSGRLCHVRHARVRIVTLYAHFPNRQALIEATLDHVLAEGRAALETADIDQGSAPEAMARAIDSAWAVLDRHMSLYAVARDEVAVQLRERHEPFLARIERLIERGRAEGSFRTDLPTSWLVTTYDSVVHGAGREIVEGRLDAADAPRLLTATLLAAFAPTPQPAAPG